MERMERIERIQLSALDSGMLERVKELYFSAFPEEERRPWESLLAALADPASGYEMRVYLLDGEFAGFISSWDLEGFRYIEHFATSPHLRGRGLGAKIIEQERKDCVLPLLLEVEPASTGDMARRRIGFYERCGFTGHEDIPYRQPAYAEGLPAVELMLMTTGPIAEPEPLIRELHSRVYGA